MLFFSKTLTIGTLLPDKESVINSKFTNAFTQNGFSERLSDYQSIADYLSHLTEDEMKMLLENAETRGQSIGGETLFLDINGKTVFIKKIAITQIEEQNPNSTENFFKLPTYYQYNLGSEGFGVWREVKIHEMTSQWVLDKQCSNFPILYHSRILERDALPHTSQEDKMLVEKSVQRWNNCPSIRQRIEARKNASTDMVLFLEHVPMTLHKWIRDELPKQTQKVNASFIQMEEELLSGVSFMQEQGILHFDLHFHNILTDGKHIYFADFGLASSLEFDLSKEERTFFLKHKNYDTAYVFGEIAFRLLAALKGEQVSKDLLNEYLATGKFNATLPTALAPTVKKYLLFGAQLHAFRENLLNDKETPYPF